MVIDLPAIAYTAAVVGGGVLGYIKSSEFSHSFCFAHIRIYQFCWLTFDWKLIFLESIPSLGAGLLFGSFLSYGTYQISVNPHNYGVMLGTSTTLGAMMAYRYYNSGKIMPAGIITVMR